MKVIRASGLNEFGCRYGYIKTNWFKRFFIRRWMKKRGIGCGVLVSDDKRYDFEIEAKWISYNRRQAEKRAAEIAEEAKKNTALGLITKTTDQLDIVKATLIDLSPEPESVDPDYVWRDDLKKAS